MRFLFLLLSFFVLTFSTLLQAQETDTHAKWAPNRSSEAIKNNPYLQNLISRGIEVIPLGQDEGFDSWLTHKDGKIQVFYTIPNSGAVISGVMIGQTGQNLTALQLSRYQAINGNLSEKKAATTLITEQSPAEKFYTQAAAQKWFGYGPEDRPYIYVFTTLDCSGCSDYLQSLLSPFVKENTIQLRVILISEGEESFAETARILSAESPARVTLERLFNRDTGFVVGDVEKTSQWLEQNNDFLSSRKLLSDRPLSLYKSASTGEIKIIKDIPKDIESVIFDLTVGGE